MLCILTSQKEDSELQEISMYTGLLKRLVRWQCATGVMYPMGESETWYVAMKILSTGDCFSLTAPSYNKALELAADGVSQVVEFLKPTPE